MVEAHLFLLHQHLRMVMVMSETPLVPKVLQCSCMPVRRTQKFHLRPQRNGLLHQRGPKAFGMPMESMRTKPVGRNRVSVHQLENNDPKSSTPMPLPNPSRRPSDFPTTKLQVGRSSKQFQAHNLSAVVSDRRLHSRMNLPGHRPSSGQAHHSKIMLSLENLR